MKKETEQLLNRIAMHLVAGSEEAVGFKKFIEQVKESEKVLTTGGYVQDSNGTPVKAGDFICFMNRFGDERNHGIAYMQVIYWAGRLSIGEPQNVIAQAASVHLFDIQDLVENDVKFFKVDEDFDEEAVYVNVGGTQRLLMPEVHRPKDGKVYMTMEDAEDNQYLMDDKSLNWTGSHF